jgi:hypothetical protein
LHKNVIFKFSRLSPFLTIREINHSFEKLEVAEKVPLPDSDKVTIDYEELTGLERMGQADVYVGKLGKSYPVAQLLDGIEKPEARKQKESPVIREKTVIKEKVQPIVIQAPEKEKKWYHTTWKVIAAVIAALISITTLIINFDAILKLLKLK